MTKNKDDNQFFNNLKNKMKSNADKMKEGVEAKSKVKPESKNKKENKEINNQKNKKSNKNYNKVKNKVNNTNKNKKKESKKPIKTKNKQEEIRRTYYLRKSVVNEIDSFAKKTGNNKSYLVELALTYFLGQVNIEELLREEDSKVEISPDKLIIPDQRSEKKVRRTYYLKESIIEKLDIISNKTDKNKSFIVEKALKFLFDNAEIK